VSGQGIEEPEDDDDDHGAVAKSSLSHGQGSRRLAPRPCATIRLASPATASVLVEAQWIADVLDCDFNRSFDANDTDLAGARSDCRVPWARIAAAEGRRPNRDRLVVPESAQEPQYDYYRAEANCEMAHSRYRPIGGPRPATRAYTRLQLFSRDREECSGAV